MHNEKSNATRTRVLVDSASPEVMGFYSLSAGSIDIALLPSDVRTKLRLNYPAPTILLSQLAVHRNVHGKGWGRILLVDAIRTAYKASLNIGAYAVAVHALDVQAKAFYEKYGFVQMPENALHLFLPMSAAAELQDSEESTR